MRKRKPSGRPNPGPFDADDMIRACIALGAEKIEPGSHSKVYKHPTAGWKFTVSTSWSSIRKGDPIFNNLKAMAGVSTKELLAILNRE